MDSNNLAAAAEALVQAAVTTTQTNSLALSRDIAASVKQLSDESKSFKESTDSKLNTTNQHLVDLKDAITSVKTALELQTDAIKLQTAAIKEQTRFQLISSALKEESYLASNRFIYRDANNATAYSDQLIKTILLNFRKGNGLYITNLYLCEGHYSSNKDSDGFEKKLCDQLHHVLGVCPKITKADGKTTIRYE
jgi:hypothetical protein